MVCLAAFSEWDYQFEPAISVISLPLGIAQGWMNAAGVPGWNDHPLCPANARRTKPRESSL